MTEQRVLVVGAGPTGLTLARQLHRHGVDVTIVDAAPGPAEQSRALAVQARTLEVLGPRLANALVAQGQPLRRAEICSGSDVVATLDLGGTPTPYPFALGLSQSALERTLIEDLRVRGVHVLRDTSLTVLEQLERGARATLSHDGATRTEDFAWVVGADGVHSTVRRLAGISTAGGGQDRWWLLADTRLSGPGVPAHDTGRVFLNPDGVLAYLPLEQGWWRIIATGSTEPGRPELSLADFERLNERSPRPVSIDEQRWMSAFRIREHVADTYRVHRVLLAGDAAHAHSPLGGQGMNTGMQDACNLAWKLAMTLRGDAGPALLDSYEAERRPVAQRLVSSTSRGTRAMLASSPWAVWLRNRAIATALSFDGVSDRARHALEMLSLSYEDSAIVAQLRGDERTHGEGPDGRRRRELRGAASAGQPVRVTEPPVAEIIDRPAHTLLLFDGREKTRDGYQRMRSVVAEVASDPYIEAFVVLADTAALGRAGDLAQCAIVDVDRSFTRTFDADTECAVVIRPDGYIGYRSDPIVPQHLRDWWAGIRSGTHGIPSDGS
ncbi:2-polyprenyl-6-methoxyphenol hydroxylase [Micromonospora siamensis]|uniref:2-polyprenyl-6-methoxyphenol hydroxylase n=2 Tax=Micromonospora siamensis TaxID=299152 RepID=A0A1C5I6J7_9ACTN|nr:2-polyprenyl-6-methoxyphenol hydroxylase [Micromonospora siamensis]